MPPIPSNTDPTKFPRLVLYQQTHHDTSGSPISLLPLVTQNTGLSHLYIAAFHLNDRPGHITLNDHEPSHPKFQQLWNEVRWLQGAGVRVMAMLGGAARGTWGLLDGSDDMVCAYLSQRIAKLERTKYYVWKRKRWTDIFYPTSSKRTTRPSAPSSGPMASRA